MNTSKINWYSFFIFKKVIPLIFVMLSTLGVAAVLGGMLPLMIAELSTFFNSPNYESVVLKLLLLFLAVYINRFIYQVFVQKYVRELIRNLRTSIFSFWINGHEVVKGDMQDSTLPKGEFMARIMSDAEALRELIMSGVFGLLIDLFFVLSALTVMIKMDLFLGGTLFIIELVVALLLIWGSRYMRTVFLEMRQEKGHVSSVLANISGGFEEAYYIEHGEYATKKGEAVFRRFLKIQLKVNLWDSVYYSLAESLYPIFLALFIIIFPYSEVTSVAIVLAILDLIQRSIDPIKGVSGKMAGIQRAITGMVRVQDFVIKISKKSDYSVYKEYELYPNFSEFLVKIDDFTYPTSKERDDKFKLSNINFRIKKGELFGIAGLSGSGKSTLLKILAGDILAENSSLVMAFKDYQIKFPQSSNLAEYKSYVSIVSQESHIFSETLRFNITMSDSDDQKFLTFWEQMVEDISYLKEWRYQVEDSLSPKFLSAGEKQLIASLRACFLKKEIVLLDEISSSLDSKLERALREVILKIQKNSVTIIVAHRLETIIHADTILVMDNGEVISHGSHESLKRTSEFYRAFLDELTA